MQVVSRGGARATSTTSRKLNTPLDIAVTKPHASVAPSRLLSQPLSSYLARAAL